MADVEGGHKKIIKKNFFFKPSIALCRKLYQKGN